MTVSLGNGRRIVRECLSARGGPDRPFGDDVVFDKLRTLASPVYPQFGPAFHVLMRADPQVLSRTWIEIVDVICSVESPVTSSSRTALETWQ